MGRIIELVDGQIRTSEHQKESAFICPPELEEGLKKVAPKVVFGNTKVPCFAIQAREEHQKITTSYYVGVDWIIKDQLSLMVESKINAGLHDEKEVDVLGMLFDSMQHTENLDHLHGLLHVEYDAPWITIPEEKDLLSPFLIVQFLGVLHKIVQKGLRKDYYRVTNNLNGRVKGKILVGEQIRRNVVKNRLTHMVCSYEEYGVDHAENRFLKYVLQIVQQYLAENERLLSGYKHKMQEKMAFCRPAFDSVQFTPLQTKRPKSVSRNAFYPEYPKALELGEAIVRRLGFNVTKQTTPASVKTPPFWINMPHLFELYVFGKLKKISPNPGVVTYHDKHNQKETDILIRTQNEEHRCVIDCKYKPQYITNSVELSDKRQVLSYTRLKSVYKKLGYGEEFSKIIKGVIIYPTYGNEKIESVDQLFSHPNREYVKLYEIGIGLPVKGS